MGWTRAHSSSYPPYNGYCLKAGFYGGWDEECAVVQYVISCAHKVSIEPGDENGSVSTESEAGEETPERDKLFERWQSEQMDLRD